MYLLWQEPSGGPHALQQQRTRDAPLHHLRQRPRSAQFRSASLRTALHACQSDTPSEAPSSARLTSDL
jgi:hypothetical protein